MLYRSRLSVTALLLLLLLLLFAGCSTPRLVPVVQPAPPLPKEARQPAPPPLCQPSCSDGLLRLLESWQRPPTSEEQPGTPASAPTKS